MLRLKGPKDEGLALRKKCEEISRHLAKGNARADEKKSNSTGIQPRRSLLNHPRCASSRPRLSLEQIDALLGTDLVNHIPDRPPLKTGKHRRSRPDAEEKDQVVRLSAVLPSWAMSFDELALFIYKHGFHDPAQGEIRLGRTTFGASRNRKRSQEDLLKAGILRTLAMLLKQIHGENFYRSPQDKVANAFTISIEKHRIDREGISAEWEFYGANHHPKIPLKDKIVHAKLSKQLLDLAAKRAASLASKSNRNGQASLLGDHSRAGPRATTAPTPISRSGVTSTNKAPRGKQETKRLISIPVNSKAIRPTRPSTTQTVTQGMPGIQGRDRKRRFRVTRNKSCDLPIHILGLHSTPTTPEKSGDTKKLRPSTSNQTTCSVHTVDIVSDDTSSSNLDTTTPTATRKLNETERRERHSTLHRPSLSAPDPGTEEIDERLNRQRRRYKRNYCKKIDLKSLILDGFDKSSARNDSDGALSTLARIKSMFPIPPKEEEVSYSLAQVEIDRLKILRW